MTRPTVAPGRARMNRCNFMTIKQGDPRMEPMDYVPALRDALALRDDGQLDAAMQRFEVLAVEHPHRIEAFLEAGKLAQKRGAWQDALVWYRDAMAVSRHNFWPYYLSVKLKQQRNDHAGCLDDLEAAGRECRGRVSEEEYDNIVKLTSDVRSVANGPPAAELQAALLRNTTPIGRPLPNAVRVSLVKDEADVIYESLESSYLSGFRYYAIADNNSSDGTRREIDRFAADRPDSIVYVVSDPVVGYFQAAKTMALARMAVTVLQGLGHPIEWVFALDADEMLYASDPSLDLSAILNRPDGANKRMLSYCFCNASSSYPHQRLDPDMDFLRHFDHYETFHRNTVRKVAFRYSAEAYLEQGNHYCSKAVTSVDQLIVGAEHGLVLRHFPVRSIEHVRTKIVNGGKALQAFNGSDALGSHWKRDYELYLEQGEGYLSEKVRRYHARSLA